MKDADRGFHLLLMTLLAAWKNHGESLAAAK